MPNGETAWSFSFEDMSQRLIAVDTDGRIVVACRERSPWMGCDYLMSLSPDAGIVTDLVGVRDDIDVRTHVACGS